MGTSASNGGSPSGSPLVPPWADIDNQGPGEVPEPQRFRGFRTTLGKFVSGGDPAVGRNALGRFVTSGLGGASTGTRRFAPAITAGGALAGLVADIAQGGTGEAIVGFNVAELAGQPTDIAIDRIVNALCPPGTTDDEAIRAALDEALGAVLGDQPEFDPDNISLEMLDELLVKYAEEEVYLKVVAESGDAFDKATDPVVLINRENELRELIRVVVDKEGRPELSSSLQNLKQGAFEGIVRKLFSTVLRTFEDYVE
ncbi:hypothetical protein [uncultured Paludibaculum sp.]|uniref:hypothetical protein n=1 Tax=uncultured Paludibaculum sp. TaxID=1765020 RepID=UPI002AAAEA6C|nr:hypothetical protein [uncultured Paludibaculum sp.]